MQMTPHNTIQRTLIMSQKLKRQTSLWMFLFSGIFTGPLQADVDTPVEDTAYLLCGGCHGPNNIRTMEDMGPNIIGQKKGYISKQLRAFRDGKRSHPSMNGAMEPYSDKNIDDLASFFANATVDLPGSQSTNKNSDPTDPSPQKHEH